MCIRDRQITAMMMRGDGDELPVSKLPVDGTYPSATTRWEKRNVSDLVAQWEKDICIQCGNCSFVCPHSVIRSKFYNKEHLNPAPEEFPSATINARGFPETRYTPVSYTHLTLADDLTRVDLGGRRIIKKKK